MEVVDAFEFFIPANIKKLASVVKITETTISIRLRLPDEIKFLIDPLLKKIKGRTIRADKTE